MEFTCNKCKNMIHKSSPVNIYSGYLCSRGLWDERGSHTDDHEDVESQYDNPFKFAPGDYWTNCQRFYPINFGKEQTILSWQCKYCGENETPCCHKCVREDGKIVSDELSTALDV